MSTIEKNSQRTPADKNKALEAVLRSHQTRIRVVGCGGGGNNTIARLMEVGVKGIETLAINTDAQDLLAAAADDKILIGQNMTKGLGAGSNPQIGEDSARESQKEIEETLLNSDLVFVTCGLGGGTGTGSAPVVAEIAKKVGALTISIVTLPFTEEGVSRWENARNGLEKLRQNSDTVIVIQNDRLLEVVPDLPLGMAFKAADEILVNAVKGVTELITEKGLVNLDFADVRTIMQNGGTAMIGIGESEGAENAQAAVEMAMQNKLLDVDITGAQNALINITGGAQMPLKDAQMVMKIVSAKLDPSAKIIWGTRIDQNLGKALRVMLIVTGLREKQEAVALAVEREKVEKLVKLPAPARKKKVLPQPDFQNNDSYSKNTVLGESIAETATMVRALNTDGEETESLIPARPARNGEEVGQNDLISPKPQRKAPLEEKPPKRSETIIADKPVPKSVETNERFSERQDFERSLHHDVQDNGEPAPITKSSAANGVTRPVTENIIDSANPVGRRGSPPSGKTVASNRIFAEQSRIHLQIIRDSIGQLFTDPTRQETLQRIKHAAIAISNLAKRFVFDVIANYAATIEEICERVLDGEINMSKKLINAFTEIPAIFDSMVHDDADALIEAKRHQERLQRLADSFTDGEVVNADMSHKRNTFASSATRPLAMPAQRPSPASRPSQMSVTRTPPPDHHSHPATEVMEYLDDFLAKRKKSPGP